MLFKQKNLDLKIMKVRDIILKAIGAPIEPYVIMAIENQKIETRAVSDNPSNPVWDERFTFDITTGQEELQVLVVNKDVYGTNETLGKTEINLQFLKD